MQRLPEDSFQYQALADCEITDDEFTQALNNYKTCMNDHGYEVTFHYEGGHFIGTEVAGNLDRTIERQCSDDNVAELESLYNGMRANPKNIDWRLEVVACLQRHEIVPEGYTVEQYDQDSMKSEEIFGANLKTFLRCEQFGAAG